MKLNLIFPCIFFLLNGCGKEQTLPDNLPAFEKAKFTNPTEITHTLYGPSGNKIYTYAEGLPGQAPEKVVKIDRRTETKKVAGINCLIQHDIVSKNGIVVEDTDDWLAQDDAGNLWYMGEFVSNYSDTGIFEDNDGSWQADVDEAEPGYWLPAKLSKGTKYYQEFLSGEAEDQAEIIEVGVTVNIPFGTFENCIVTKDFTTLEPKYYEKKYYAPSIGLIKAEKFDNDVLIQEEILIKIE